MTRNIVITGGAGFIGSNLVEHLNQHNPQAVITVIDDLSTGRLENLDGLRAGFVKADLSMPGAAAEVLAGADTIVHLGALGSVPRSVANPVRSHEANINATLHVLEAARESGAHVIFASSSSVYGSNKKLPKNELDWTRPLSPYAVTKQAGEAYVLAYQAAYNLPTLAFRFFNVYGPKQPADHDYAAVIPRFLDAALNGRPLQVHGDGLQSRDFTFVDTVCNVLYQAVVDSTVSKDPINLAFGTNTTLLALIDLIEKQLGRKVAVEFTDPRTGDVRASQADGILLRETFPEVEPVALEEGLRATIGWFLEGTEDGK